MVKHLLTLCLVCETGEEIRTKLDSFKRTVSVREGGEQRFESPL